MTEGVWGVHSSANILHLICSLLTAVACDIWGPGPECESPLSTGRDKTGCTGCELTIEQSPLAMWSGHEGFPVTRLQRPDCHATYCYITWIMKLQAKDAVLRGYQGGYEQKHEMADDRSNTAPSDGASFGQRKRSCRSYRRRDSRPNVSEGSRPRETGFNDKIRLYGLGPDREDVS